MHTKGSAIAQALSTRGSLLPKDYVVPRLVARGSIRHLTNAGSQVSSEVGNQGAKKIKP